MQAHGRAIALLPGMVKQKCLKRLNDKNQFDKAAIHHPLHLPATAGLQGRAAGRMAGNVTMPNSQHGRKHCTHAKYIYRLKSISTYVIQQHIV
jgi:hypothetical protein